jgi:hypothetical protein
MKIDVLGVALRQIASWAPARIDRSICFEADPGAKALRTVRPGVTAALPDEHALDEAMPFCTARFSRELKSKTALATGPGPD